MSLGGPSNAYHYALVPQSTLLSPLLIHTLYITKKDTVWVHSGCIYRHFPRCVRLHSDDWQQPSSLSTRNKK